VFVLALAVCAFTAAGHDSPEAVAEWAACCSQATRQPLGGRRDPWAGRIRPPSVRTFSRIFGRIDAEAFNAAVCGYLAALLPQSAGDGQTVRGALRGDGSQVHLLSVFDVATGTVRGRREVDAKANEIPELAPAVAHLDLIGQVVTLDALHTQAETARHLA
jgi:hypothetical protein